MKKRLITLLLAMCCVCMCACGSESNSGNNANTGNNNSNSEKESQTNDETSFVFTHEGMEISVNEDIESVLDKLGEPIAYYEAASCAFEGLDKFYTYSSFQLDTYPQDGKDMVASIYFKDDLVKTTEGVSLYMTKEDMIAAYGEATTEDGNVYVYEKGNGCLRFILDGKEIISIEYQTKVDYN